MNSQDIGTGAYASGKPLIARWSLVNGYPRCVEAPLAIADTDIATLAACIAHNRALAALCARTEAVEAAVRLAGQPAPKETLSAVEADGQTPTAPNPAFEAWQAAGVLAAELALDAALGLWVRTRADSFVTDPVTGVAEPAFALTLPAVPAIPDPLTQTADWNGTQWIVRDLTDDERATWPLRPAPSLDKLRFAGLLRAVLGDGLAASILTSADVALILTLAGRVDWDDVFIAATDGPAYADRLIAAGAITSANVAALKAAWPLAA